MNKNFVLILPATIDPRGMPDLVRDDVQTRLNDYLKAFDFWIKQKEVENIIFIENSGYDLAQFHIIKNKSFKNIELISTDKNNFFNRKLGKGYGKYLCLEHIFKNSELIKNNNFIITVTGRYIIKNFKKIYFDIFSQDCEIYINLRDNLKFADTSIFAGSKFFFKNYLIKYIKNTNDSEKQIFENRAAQAVLEAINNGLNFKQPTVYAHISGFIGTNGKKYKYNFFKKIRLFFYGKLKKYFFQNKRY